MTKPTMFRTMAILALAGLIVSGCAGPGDRRGGGPGLNGAPIRAAASPSEIVATEIAFARAAREDGQWTAFREYAGEEAIMFVPEMVRAQQWLAGRADPAEPVQWQSHAVYMSCDGLTAASTGAWQRGDGTTGYYTTIWQRQLRGQRLGEWRWLLDHGDVLAEPRAMQGDLITTQVARCPDRPAGMRPPRADAPERVTHDDSLRWDWQTGPGNSRTVTVSLRTDTGYQTVIEDRVAGQTGP